MMSKRLLSRGLIAALVLSLASAAVAAAQAGKIAIVDTRRLLTGSAAGKQVIDRLDKMAEEKSGQLKARQDEIQVLQKKIADGRISLSEEKLAQMQRELDDKMTAGRRLREDLQKEMEAAQQSAFEQFEQKVAPIVEKFGTDGGYLMILNIGFFNQPNLPSGIVWADSSIDVTDDLIRQIDAGTGGAAKP